MMRDGILPFCLGVAAGLLLKSALDEARAREESNGPLRPVRDAGTEDMDDPPHRWDMVDEQVDASFPASDPPGNY